jgi:hypothetical protein
VIKCEGCGARVWCSLLATKTFDVVLYHLLTDPGCGKCIGATQAKDRQERNAREDAKEAEKKDQENAFFNPGKDRKKPKKDKDGKTKGESANP